MTDDTNVGMPTFDVDSLGFSDTVDETTEPQAQEKEQEPQAQPEQKQEQPVEVKEETPTEKPAEESKPEEKKDITISNPPRRHDNESDIQYNLRTQIYNAGQAKAQAESQEEKSFLSKHISELRKELAIASKPQKVETTQSQETKVETPVDATNEVSEEEQIKQQIKKMGFLTAEEAEQKALEIVSKTTRQQEQDSAIQQFYQTRKDIASNPQYKELLQQMVLQRFNINENSSGADILVAMDMAASYLFPKVDNRASNAQAAADKRDLVNFSSNTKSDTEGIDKNDKKTKDTLKEIGWTDEDLKSFGF